MLFRPVIFLNYWVQVFCVFLPYLFPFLPSSLGSKGEFIGTSLASRWESRQAGKQDDRNGVSMLCTLIHVPEKLIYRYSFLDALYGYITKMCLDIITKICSDALQGYVPLCENLPVIFFLSLSLSLIEWNRKKCWGTEGIMFQEAILTPASFPIFYLSLGQVLPGLLHQCLTWSGHC